MCYDKTWKACLVNHPGQRSRRIRASRKPEYADFVLCLVCTPIYGQKQWSFGVTLIKLTVLHKEFIPG